MAADPQNLQYDPAQSKFFAAQPGSSTGAPGSGGATEAQAMPDDAFRPQVTMPYQSVQNVPVPTVGVGLDDTAEPGQDTEGVSGQTITSTGAGQGSVSTPHHLSAGR